MQFYKLFLTIIILITQTNIFSVRHNQLHKPGDGKSRSHKVYDSKFAFRKPANMLKTLSYRDSDAQNILEAKKLLLVLNSAYNSVQINRHTSRKKDSLPFITILCLSLLAVVSPAEGTITRISKDNLEIIKPDIQQFHKPTTSADNTYGYNPSPDVSRLENDGQKLLVAKIDSFGLDRYFVFETNEDINQLVNTVKIGGGSQVEWYYLEDPYKYPLIYLETEDII